MPASAKPPAPDPAGTDPANWRRAFPDGAVIDQWPCRDGWPLRRLVWPDGPGAVRGSMLFLGGRGDHFEKYLETFGHWSNQGWRVESVDWRGQGGSGRTGSNPAVGHIADFALWIDDLADYVADWLLRTPGPHVITGHSMGGHLLLRALAERRVAPDAAVLVAPMLGFTAPYPDPVGRAVARLFCHVGAPDRAAWKASEKPGASVRLRQMLLTHDDGRYADELWWRERNPGLAIGPASWRWVERAYDSFIGLSQGGVVEGVTTPVLVLVASADKLVSARATTRLAARLPMASVHVYGPEAAHELLREADGVRNDALGRITAFLDSHCPKVEGPPA